MSSRTTRSVRTVLTRCAALAAAAVLVVACSSDNEAAPTSSAAPTTDGLVSATVTPEETPEESHEEGDDHDHDEDHSGDHDVVEDEDGHTHTPRDPLAGGDLDWYTAFCDATSLVIPVNELEVADPAEAGTAYAAWLQGISDSIEPKATALSEQDPVAVAFGGLIQADVAGRMLEAKNAAATAIETFAAGGSGDQAWIDETLAPYKEAVAGIEGVVESYREALLPEEHLEQITGIAGCKQVFGL